MQVELQKKLEHDKAKRLDRKAWAMVDAMGELTEEQRLIEFEKALNTVADQEERLHEEERQKMITWILKSSKVHKKSNINDLSTTELKLIISQVQESRQRAEIDKKKKLQAIDELHKHGYGTKSQLSRMKEVDFWELQKKFKADLKANPQKFDETTSAVPQTAERPKKTTATAKPKVTKKAPCPIVRTDFRMMVLEGDTILDDAFTHEEKPFIIQGRDPATFAYKLQTTEITESQTKVTVEEHLPRYDLRAAHPFRRSGVTIQEIPQDSTIPSTGERSIIAYTHSSLPRIKSWTITKENYHMMIFREDETVSRLKNQSELKCLSTQDLLRLTQLSPLHGSAIPDDLVQTVKEKMHKAITDILDERLRRDSSK